ncbi:MAG: ribonuclease P protein component [Gammaproteobacteria bacterium]|nr:ribonuclease P protein component [Gammaproteobacteria bacterium]
MHQPAEFNEVRRGGRRFSDDYFSLQVLANRGTHPRLGLAISTRAAGCSVARNRLKRIARESFRVNQTTLPAVDVTVAARDAARGADSRALRASLERLWVAIRRRG